MNVRSNSIFSIVFTSSDLEVDLIINCFSEAS